MEHIDSLIEVCHHGEEDVDGDWFCSCIERRDDGLVLHVQPDDDEGEQFILADRLDRCRELVGEGPHMTKICSNRLGALLGIGEGDPYVVGARERHGREHVPKLGPYRI